MKIEDSTVRAVLAILLVVMSFVLIVLWMLHPPSGEASALALLSGFVMLMLKTAADLATYYTQSSAGSDRKTDALVNNVKPEAH